MANIQLMMRSGKSSTDAASAFAISTFLSAANPSAKTLSTSGIPPVPISPGLVPLGMIPVGSTPLRTFPQDLTSLARPSPLPGLERKARISRQLCNAAIPEKNGSFHPPENGLDTGCNRPVS